MVTSPAKLVIATAVFCAIMLPHAGVAQLGRLPLARVGLWTQFDERGFPNGYWPGQLIQNFNQFDAVVGHLVSDEAASQLDAQRGMGVNAITLELRTSNADCNAAQGCETVFPSCQISSALGLDWPQPTAAELTNLTSFFALAAGKGIKVDLVLTITHMDEPLPRPLSKAWIGSILGAVKDSPALDLVLFNGDAQTIDTNGDGIPDACGGQAEPPLWLGPGSYGASYIAWAMRFAMTQGMRPKQLSAEAIVGDFNADSEAAAGPTASDGHLWPALYTLTRVFEAAGIAADRRVYALSFYEHRKCAGAFVGLACSDLGPHAWAKRTIENSLAIVGSSHHSQLLMTEGGSSEPSDWPAQFAFESLGFLFQKYGLPGGNFWRWVAFQDSEDTDPNLARAVKARGVSFNYFPPQKEILDLGGFHLTKIPNGSFERGQGSGPPTRWTIAGAGTGVRYFLAGEPKEPQVPSRGKHDLRLTTSSDAGAVVTASSPPVAVSPETAYTTSGNLRFNWSGDPNPGAPPSERPQVFVEFDYYTGSGAASAGKASDTFGYFQEDSTGDFATFPFQYTTPSDAAFVKIVIGAARNGLPTPITFDADNLR